MKKDKFLALLKEKLKGLPKDDLDNRLSFYEEAINDRISCGKSEEEAVADLGSVDHIVAEIAEQTPYFTLVKEKNKLNTKLSITSILLLILGFPLWFPLSITFSIVIWIIVLIPGIVSIASFAYSVIAFIAVVCGESFTLYFGIVLAGLGLSILFMLAAIYSVKGFLKLIKLILIRRKTKLITKEEK